MPANVFVLGLDQLNLDTLAHLPQEDYAFHELLHKDELIGIDDIDIPALLNRAEERLESFAGPIDAVIGYWDFPVSSMVPILCRRRGLPSAPLEAVVKCEHKYWSRLEQRKVIGEVPAFALVDLEGDGELPPDLELPVWLKPVKSVSSELAFHVGDRTELDEALGAIREGIDKYGEPFEFVLDQIDLPPEIAAVGATACLAEEAAVGQQLTVEGYAQAGRAHVYGIIDSLTYPDSSSFLRYQYPSRLPAQVRARLVDISTRVIEHLGLESTTFNIEYFWDPDRDRIRLLEVNPRHSQSHAKMFEAVDGVSNHEVMVELALGRAPGERTGGAYGVAAKWFLRTFDDGVVTRSPSPEDVARVEQELDGVTVHVVAQQGGRLSELAQQDSYSYELAQVFVGARDEAELIEKYERVVQLLPIEITDGDGARG
ncbi:ATP-grasp domain-containing protein [Blastococcus sp. BMG 814]|uniref:ATP-grasp domain-containing protein n=1 Tax=Blastococcus carthaginiensis TaxID=3050034 RepID=A0ABT9ICS4_9ACTN|nr:ATP-grasp domain-containing protein [Blastococcus carthaginiensis]MDP5183381.1 ATP-grasp domain-containing protein [Blastococcus carthaginiensis]